MWIAILCYTGYLIRSSKINFQQEILKSVSNRLHVGDVGHSSKVYSKFMPFVSEQVTEWTKSFSSCRVDHTRCNLPVNLQTNKGTNVHRTRQFTSMVTFVMESPKLLTYIYLSQPAVKSHDRRSVTQGIIYKLNSLHNQGDQVEGGSFDRKYFYHSVPAHLTEAPDLSEQFICAWYSLRKGDVVDNHIRENSSFFWLVEIQTIFR